MCLLNLPFARFHEGRGLPKPKRPHGGAASGKRAKINMFSAEWISGAVLKGPSAQQRQSRVERLFYRQIRRIKQVRICGLFQRRGGAVHVARIAGFDIGQNSVEGKRVILCAQFLKPPFGAHFGARRDEEFFIRVRTHDRADIAAVQNRTGFGVGRGGGELALRWRCRAF